VKGKTISSESGLALVNDKGAIARGFFSCLALLTIVPLAGFPLTSVLAEPHATIISPQVMLVIVTLAGSMHVAASSFFYADQDFRPLIAENRPRFLWSIALVPVTLLAFGVYGGMVLGPWAAFLVFAFHGAWLFHHYQRQNFGLISLASTNAGLGRVPSDVNVLLNLSAAAGIVSALRIRGFLPGDADQIVGANLHAWLLAIAVAIYAVSLALLVRAMIRHPSLRSDPWVTGGLLVGWAFFLPTLAVPTMAAGFLPLATAHGLQYMLMMTVLSGRSQRGVVGFAMMMALALGIGWGLDAMRDLPPLFFMTGLVQVHFLIDAKLWRLREPLQRSIISHRFDFLFKR
jgi:hypothetical protein